MLRHLIVFGVPIAAALLAGVIGSQFTTESIPGWYATLTKPWFTPPNWIFAPVWTFLYVLMGLSAGLVWLRGREGKQLPLVVYVAHLFVNALWSVVFFGLHKPLAALIVIGFLMLLIVGLMILSYRHSKLATYLLIPYLLWVCFATLLNSSIVLLN